MVCLLTSVTMFTVLRRTRNVHRARAHTDRLRFYSPPLLANNYHQRSLLLPRTVLNTESIRGILISEHIPPKNSKAVYSQGETCAYIHTAHCLLHHTSGSPKCLPSSPPLFHLSSHTRLTIVYRDFGMCSGCILVILLTNTSPRPEMVTR